MTTTHNCILNFEIDEHKMEIWPQIIDLGKPHLLLGIPWLQTYNPKIDWSKQTINWCQKDCHKEELADLINTIFGEEDKYPENEDKVIFYIDASDIPDVDDEYFNKINLKTNTSQMLVQQYSAKKKLTLWR